MDTKVGVCGAAGRMGKVILEVCNETENIEIGAAIECSSSPMVGIDAGEQAGIGLIGVLITDDFSEIVNKFDVLIDFTVATSFTDNLAKCHASGKSMVIGTTGLDDNQKELIKKTAEDIPIVFAPNMSIGVNLCLKLLETAAQVIGDDADIEIIEAHHRHKKDAPSGTSLHMGEVIADTLGRNLRECAIYSREGITSERDKNTIGFATIRAGDIVGEHTVMFALAGELVEITHKATSRKTFASGAVRAAQWLKGKDKGLFSMQNVLGF